METVIHSALAKKISVLAESRYLGEESQPNQEHYCFSFTIRIVNFADMGVKLIDRHWYITDGEGVVEQVRGKGVVGQQPHLVPGRSFQYSSRAEMKTPVGTMHGFYGFISDEGDYFLASIPVFRLAVPELVQ
jgi:ApaG protein